MRKQQVAFYTSSTLFYTIPADDSVFVKIHVEILTSSVIHYTYSFNINQICSLKIFRKTRIGGRIS